MTLKVLSIKDDVTSNTIDIGRRVMGRLVPNTVKEVIDGFVLICVSVINETVKPSR